MIKIDELFPKYSEEGKILIEDAYRIAETALESHERGNGRPFIEHPLGVAKIVADEVGLPAECVAAVFLHEAMRFHPETDIRSQRNFGNDVYTIVDGLNKISSIKPKDTRLEAENYKKLIVSYSRDPRVTVLKLADRLEVMRNLDIFPKLSRERKILETLMLYIPLAHQLGLYNMKSEMEDIYFRYAEPEQYRSITNKLKSTEKDRQMLMTQFIEPLKQKLSDSGITYKLKIRTKTAYSIWKKMQKQKVPFEGVFDVFAIRFIIDCDEDRETEHALCWKVFSYVTEEYESDTKRLRDWISNPKPNGYESLHITVRNSDNVYLEVQIRTKRMDDIAENGLASHWSYKGIKREATLDKWLSSVRFALELRVQPEAYTFEGIKKAVSAKYAEKEILPMYKIALCVNAMVLGYFAENPCAASKPYVSSLLEVRSAERFAAFSLFGSREFAALSEKARFNAALVLAAAALRKRDLVFYGRSGDSKAELIRKLKRFTALLKSVPAFAYVPNDTERMGLVYAFNAAYLGMYKMPLPREMACEMLFGKLFGALSPEQRQSIEQAETSVLSLEEITKKLLALGVTKDQMQDLIGVLALSNNKLIKIENIFIEWAVKLGLR